MPTDPSPAPPSAMRQALAKLGADLNAARRRRRLPIAELAARAHTTRQTIGRLERGEPTVAMGTWVSVLFALGLGDRLPDLTAPANDMIAAFIEREHLPTRVHPYCARRSRASRATSAAGTPPAGRSPASAR